jgi:hypothetical protein
VARLYPLLILAHYRIGSVEAARDKVEFRDQRSRTDIVEVDEP